MFDVAVVGLGAIGSATVYQTARRKGHVLGIDQFAPPHPFGSTHSDTRITREAIGEGAHLTPLARRSHQLWREIEQETGTELLVRVGVLIISGPAKTSVTHVQDFLDNTVTAARRYGIAHEILDAPAVRTRYPQFRLRDDETGYFEPGAGFVRPEACVAAQLALAQRYGADIRPNERVTGFVPRADHVVLTTEHNRYCTKKLVLAVGAWLPDFLEPEIARAFPVFRQAMYWFQPHDNSFRPQHFPAFIWELSGRSQPIYGFPDIDGTGVKVATEQFARSTSASEALHGRDVPAAEAIAMHEDFVAPFLPGLPPNCVRAAACLYTVTADFDFVIDRHPLSERVIVASCCSGHGFKHSPALGEVLSELTLTGRAPIDVTPFNLARLLPR